MIGESGEIISSKDDLSSEEIVLKYLAYPYGRPAGYSRKPLSEIATALKQRTPRILFDWFWTHEDVKEFSDHQLSKINPDDVEWYLRELAKCLKEDQEERIQPSWIEQVNLFHSFGLLRLIDDKAGVKLLKEGFGLGDKGRAVTNLVDFSGWNTLAMLNSGSDSLLLLDAIRNDTRILKPFADYQVFYYGGYENVLNTMKRYLKSEKQNVVPQTAAALLRWLEDNGYSMESDRVHDELIDALPLKIKRRVDDLALGRRRNGAIY